MEGTARPAGPGYGTRRLRCPWAAARPGRASRRRTQPHTATQAPPVRRAPEGTEGTGALRADTPIRICHRAPLGREAGYPGGGTHAVGPGRASHSDTSAAGMEGADRTRGLRCQAAGPVGGGRAWPGFETTRPATHSDTSAAGAEGAGGHGGPGGGARGRRRGLAGLRGDAPSHAQRHTRRRDGGCRQDQRVAVPGCGARGRRQGLAGLRDDAPSEARGADGSRAGRRPRAHHQPSSPPPTGTPSSPAPARTHAHAPFRHNKTARPHWGRAAVAVALGFEPRVAVTPHSISSAAPSAARTRYLTRTLYYTDPRSAQIDRAGWDQGHTTSQDHTAARNTGATSAYRTVENKIK